MDNDKKLVKIAKKTIKNIKFNLEYSGYKILDEEKGNEEIKKTLLDSSPTMIARCGATEMRCVAEYLSKNSFSEKIKHEISDLSGVFPTNDSFLRKFCEYYIECISEADILALWGVGAESKIVKKKDGGKTIYIKLPSLEPYYFAKPWSACLKGKKVLVVHPFEESIKKQYENRKKIFLNQEILPDFSSLVCIKAVQSIAGQKTNFENWFDALEYMKDQIRKEDFDVAIIGAGAYSLPLAAFVKEIGKKSIQMSGATQILFGIKGKRWEEIPEVSKMFNEYWVRPMDNEKPEQSQKVEGGSYW